VCLVTVAEFKCVGMILGNQNGVHEEVRNWMSWGNACCCHWVQNVALANCYRDTHSSDVACCLYGHEGLSVTLREEVVTIGCSWGRYLNIRGGWRKLHKEEWHDFYFLTKYYSGDELRMRWVWHVAWLGERRSAHKVLVGKPEVERPLGRPRHRWEDNKMNFTEIERLVCIVGWCCSG